MTIRLVTFDFWSTLLADTRESTAAAHALRLDGVREALAQAGYLYDPEAVQAADGRALAALQGVWNAQRDVSPADQVRIFLEALEPALPALLSAAAREAVEAAYGTPALTHSPVVSPGAVEAVRGLAAEGLVLGIISNTGRTPGRVLRRLLDRAGILGDFGVLSFSDEVGVRKPAAGIFEATLTRAGCPPKAAVHVGDDPVSDVAGARAAGMRALHYLPEGRAPADGADGVIRHLAEVPALLSRLA